MWFLSHKSRDEDQAEREKIARLINAEKELVTLKARATNAMSVLDERRQRNHWRESIEHMIQGGI